MTAPAALDHRLLARLPLPSHDGDASKEDRGRLLVVGGSAEVPGAALLAATGGLRAGAGKLQIATADSVAPAIGVAMPEARVIAFAEAADGGIAAADVDPILALAREARAVVVGCGLRYGASLDGFLDALLDAGLAAPLILDAAVLGSLAPRAGAVRAQRAAVLLPHAGEMARLLGMDEETVCADPRGAARAAATTFGAVTVMKGAESFIAAPDGREFHYSGGGIGLATSGSGDVLAGIVGGLAARGADALTATLWGVYLHGEAGRRLAVEVGRLGFLAREIAGQVPALMEGRAPARGSA